MRAISVMAWVYPFDWNGNRRIVQKGNNDNQYRLLAENGELVWHLNGAGRLETALPPANTWSHIAGTYDGAEMRIYVNGEVVASMAATGAIATTTASRNAGCNSSVALTSLSSMRKPRIFTW